MPTLLKCPSCTAPLDLSGRSGEVVTCSFCGHSVMLPDEDEPAPRVVRVELGNLGPAVRRGAGAAVVLGIVLPVVGIAVAFVAILVVSVWPKSAPEPARPIVVTPAPPPAAKPAAPAKPAFATSVLTFGGEGIGPGLFEDNRTVAVDREGRIYSADYSDGRLQVFDAEGKFLTQWQADPDRALLDVLADRAGRVFVLYPGLLVVHEAGSGAVLGTVERFYAEDLTLTPDNRLLALGDDDVRQIDEKGKVLARIDGLRARASAKRADFEAMAVDGLGNMYVVESHTATIYKFDRSGAFVDKFGGQTEYPDYFAYPNDVAVDGKGRVYASCVGQIRVFDPEGRVAGAIDVRQAFDLAFDDAGALYVAARPTVVKLRVDGS